MWADDTFLFIESFLQDYWQNTFITGAPKVNSVLQKSLYFPFPMGFRLDFCGQYRPMFQLAPKIK